MGEGRKTFERLAADALSRAIWSNELGVFVFELLEPVEQLVVLLIRNRRIGFDVVSTVVPADLVAKRGDFLFGWQGRAMGCWGVLVEESY